MVAGNCVRERAAQYAGPMQRVVVAIDGPSGSGKSSVARAVAQEFGLAYLDTGAMYRAFAWWSLQGHDDMSTCPLRISTEPGPVAIVVADHDVSEAIRGPEVTERVSLVAADPRVRAEATRRQREIIEAAPHGIVVEGRDITTVVAPDADVRIFLTADLAAREARRAAEFSDPTLAERMRATIAARDYIDSTREHAPLVQADGVVRIDATDMTLPEVIAVVRDLIRSRREEPAHDR